jgi:hypothetical protein
MYKQVNVDSNVMWRVPWNMPGNCWRCLASTIGKVGWMPKRSGGTNQQDKEKKDEIKRIGKRRKKEHLDTL